MNNQSEKHAYIVIISLLYISLLGFSSVRYAFYLSPVFAFFIWIAGSVNSISFRTAPFVLLLLASIPSAYDLNFYSFKLSYFIFVYAFLFSIFDFSKIEINFNKVLLCIFILFLFNVLRSTNLNHFTYSVLNSESTFENTLAFPVGILALYFFMSKKYISFILSTLLCIIMLKRIVILALIVSLMPRFFGKKLQNLIVNPYFVTFFACLTLFLSIELANGSFDVFFKEFFHQSTNQLAQGRQTVWRTALTALHFNYADFAFWGVGQGKATALLDKLFHIQDVRLHNDMLLIVLQFGILIFIGFTFLFNNNKTQNERTLSLFITIIFFTDNVLIYQHVMVIYFLALSQLERHENNDKSVI